MKRRVGVKLLPWCNGKAKARLAVEQRSSVSRKVNAPRNPIVEED